MLVSDPRERPNAGVLLFWFTSPTIQGQLPPLSSERSAARSGAICIQGDSGVAGSR